MKLTGRPAAPLSTVGVRTFGKLLKEEGESVVGTGVGLPTTSSGAKVNAWAKLIKAKTAAIKMRVFIFFSCEGERKANWCS